MKVCVLQAIIYSHEHQELENKKHGDSTTYFLRECGIEQVASLSVGHTLGFACAARGVQQEEEIFTVHHLWMTFSRLLGHLLHNITQQICMQFTYLKS